ncbi:MAG: glutathione S-transferase N-terminal domain-containing protein [Salaquimonas sp.]|nr:glutathione S-transferase N-terminal domain-containing protein [Salaquimonas sp.]
MTAATKSFPADFPITRKWPAENPQILQLYSFPTPNGIKVSAMLEETGIAYEPHLVSFATNDQLTPEFISLNPNNKIPAIVDPDGPGGRPLALFESGAILIYLADKTGKLISSDPAGRYETLQWLMFQMGGIGPMFGQFGFFHKFAGKEIEDRRPFERYRDESKRLLSVLDARLKGRDFIMGENYTIADIATWPWVRAMVGFYEGGAHVGIDDLAEVKRWLDACCNRPASQRAVNIPKRD